jgi:hypothetical protein
MHGKPEVPSRAAWQVAARQVGDEILGKVRRRVLAIGIVPARGPVERARDGEGQQLGIGRRQRAVGDRLADQFAQGVVDPALERAELLRLSLASASSPVRITQRPKSSMLIWA